MFEPIVTRGASEQVASRLRAELLGGRFAPGELLPPERELAVQLGVSRLTLRQGMARLLAQGLITVRQGDGTRATDFRQMGTLDLLIDLFRAVKGTARATKLLSDLLELRRNAASEVVAMACERRTVAQLKAIERQVALLEKRLDEGASRAEIAEAEVAVSRAVIDATGNLAYALLLNAIHRFTRAFPDVREAVPADAELLKTSYRALLGLIEAKDADSAREAVRAAMTAVDAELLRKVSHGTSRSDPRGGARDQPTGGPRRGSH